MGAPHVGRRVSAAVAVCCGARSAAVFSQHSEGGCGYVTEVVLMKVMGENGRRYNVTMNKHMTMGEVHYSMSEWRW